jgi:monovalent cation:H+ antiporter-2, CPA2 family
MTHNVALIATVVAAFGLSMVLGYLATRVRMPPVVGYLVAGLVIGPATPGFVGDVELASQLADIGVMLLMFGVGLNFSLKELMAVRRIAVPGAIGQTLVAAALGLVTARLWGWSLGGAIVFGLCLSVASTVVVLRALEAKGLLKTVNGQITMGWLVVQDLIAVLVLVLLPALSGILSGPGEARSESVLGGPWIAIGFTMLKVAVFVALMLVVGRRLLPRILWWMAGTGSRELFTLGVVGVAVCVAWGAAQLFEVSFALGAFFAGMMMRESQFSRRAAAESLPLRDAFAVLFFVSVGMLFDPAVVWTSPLRLLATVAVVILGNAAASVALVLLVRYPLATALTVGASLAQIGEFAFILAGLGVSLDLMPQEGHSLVLAAAVLSIAVNPLLMVGVEAATRVLRKRAASRRADRHHDPLARLPATTHPSARAGQVVLVGHGRVGRRIGEALRERSVPFVVVELNRDTVEALRAEGQPAICGDAADPAVLPQAHLEEAAMLVIAIPDTVNVRKMVETARRIHPDVPVVLRTHNEEEARLLAEQSVGRIFLGEEELAQGMTRHILGTLTGEGAEAREAEEAT